MSCGPWGVGGGLVHVEMVQFILYVFLSKDECVKCIAYISWELWNVVQLFVGEHRTKVCVESFGHVIVSGDYLASGRFEWSYIISNYSSLIDVGVEAFMVSFA